ncbi:hypothetical protein E2C01_045566 [Portunus trituberculatus]|uniref:Uncharacterized protein n=1 Tax=Portunus trituberculatus TaxID=210409 RepID=A0A5B7G5D6_PORTR|nr:hypothetical protein [Portunus trituberculatus]
MPPASLASCSSSGEGDDLVQVSIVTTTHPATCPPCPGDRRIKIPHHHQAPPPPPPPQLPCPVGVALLARESSLARRDVKPPPPPSQAT